MTEKRTLLKTGWPPSLQHLTNLKHKALLPPALACGASVMAYSAGVRVSEVDFKRMQILVTAGKGAKDRSIVTLERHTHVTEPAVARIGPMDNMQLQETAEGSVGFPSWLHDTKLAGNTEQGRVRRHICVAVSS